MGPSPASLAATAVGDITVTFVPDGVIRLPVSATYGEPAEELFAANRHLLDDRGDLVLSLGAVLVETADSRVLVDLGWGPSTADLAALSGGRIPAGGMRGGELLQNLRSLGIGPEDVDLVLLSHLHADHIGWVADDDGRPTFARADHCLAAAEWDHWHGPAGGGAAGPRPPQSAALRDRLRTIRDGECVSPGVNVVLTAGHTPGHCSFVVSSRGQRAIVLGDTVHCALEIAHPELELLGDVDPRAAGATRARLRQMLAGDDDLLAVAPHLPDTVFGRVVRGDTASGWSLRALS
ncbi:MBL fold metallo-hydrolase [Pseudonocardia dioxanivorans]|jgi:glyoxylase-like metal-dependent hydrolase (beta-lactamase superfamily II)|uniref:MBL fold metallo-hydrolase n=1 Tax=Pseudonocardia dioxanivorans TaxID=240495 RepID=UPI00140552A1|nr:MBL fold metallo-hydrolase [Pseudonocardia dioxanivorans]